MYIHWPSLTPIPLILLNPELIDTSKYAPSGQSHDLFPLIAERLILDEWNVSEQIEIRELYVCIYQHCVCVHVKTAVPKDGHEPCANEDGLNQTHN